MPNWCSNRVAIYHEDTSKLEVIAEAVKAGNFCKHVIPVPEDLEVVAGRVGDDNSPEQIELVKKQEENRAKYGYDNWYDFCVNRWGTKWDIDPYDSSEVKIGEDGVLEFCFDSAWSPPIGVYEELYDQGFTVEATYYESGMAYVGRWDNGSDDFYEFSGMNADEIRDYIGEELDDEYGITESMREWDEMNREEEELYKWTKEGGEAKGLPTPGANNE